MKPLSAISLDSRFSVLGSGEPPEHRYQSPSPELARTLVRDGVPVVFPGFAKDWSAVRNWTLEHLAEITDNTPVHIEQGNIMQDESRFESVGLRDYLRDVSEGKSSNDGDSFRYLASLDLLALKPELEKDIDFSWFKAVLPVQFVFAWLGPSNTISGYHYDAPDNFFVQVHGRKLVHLVPPSQSEAMYPSDKWDYGACLSSVDAFEPDYKRYPAFAEVRPFSVVLEPGDGLFIPRHWWHHLVSLDPSISINCFAYRRPRFLMVEAREMAKAVMHRFGLYGSECTCHQWVDGVRVPKPGKHPLV